MQHTIAMCMNNGSGDLNLVFLQGGIPSAYTFSLTANAWQGPVQIPNNGLTFTAIKGIDGASVSNAKYSL